MKPGPTVHSWARVQIRRQKKKKMKHEVPEHRQECAKAVRLARPEE